MKQQIRVIRAGDDRTEFSRALRLVGRMEITEAHEVAAHLDRYPDSLLVAGIDSHVAQHIAEVLRAAGAQIAVEDSALETPMLCTPWANFTYEWGAMRTIRRAS